ncbi:MAG: hypothetical protein K0R60_1710 [Microbacterium sp.]|nr:hypothetical protein [Microbacterium sp.]
MDLFDAVGAVPPLRVVAGRGLRGHADDGRGAHETDGGGEREDAAWSRAPPDHHAVAPGAGCDGGVLAGAEGDGPVDLVGGATIAWTKASAWRAASESAPSVS